MQGPRFSRGGARRAYEQTAPFYDAFSAHHDYERWLPRLVVLARRHGQCGTRLLDVGCGTGKSFLPLLRAGWDVTACDVSPAMLRRARSKAAGLARLELGDIRDLPRFGCFDLVWALGDVVNHMLGPDELEHCMHGLARNLAPGGRVLFDANTLRSYQGFYAETAVQELGDRSIVWRGHGTPATRPSSEVSATFEVRFTNGDARGLLARAVHRQRHFRVAEIAQAMGNAGLECLAVFGQGYTGNAEQPVDEYWHTKAIFIGKRGEGR